MKKNKNGFFLPETIVVISIVAVVLLGVFQVFSSVFLRYTETEKYNTVNSLNAVAAVQKYLESTSVNYEDVLGDAYYIDLTDNYSSEIFKRIKEEYSIDKTYLIDLNQLFQDDNIGVFNVTTRKYLETFNKQNGIILVAVVNGNEFASSKVSGSLSVKLIGDESDEYAVYVKLGGSFVDPGYKNWNGLEPTKTWEAPLDINQEGTYYLVYDFDGYLVRRKVVVISKTDFEYDYTGSIQTFTAPVSGTYKVELWGAQGGGEKGGMGGYTSGLIALVKGEKLFVNVGQKGPANATTTNVGGYNGGGYSGNDGGAKSYGGGGATDVRLVAGSWSDAKSLNSRIMVAAGGAGTTSALTTLAGGGGGLIGINGTSSNATFNTNAYLPIGSNQTGVGFAYETTKRQGAFGYAIQSNTTGWGGGGGGGYYGGSNGHGTTGSGGSSYISGHTGAVAIISESDTTAKSGCTTGTSDNSCSIHYSGKMFTNTIMIDGQGYNWTNEKGEQVQMPSPSGVVYATGEGHSGNGYAKIALVTGENSSSEMGQPVKNGLKVWLDANYNTGTSHSNTATTWKDLSGNGIDGVISGAVWGSNYLKFDGSNDWVKLTQMNYSNYTIEIVTMPEALPSSEVDLVANFESGGYGLVFVNGYAKNLAYVSSAYKEAKVPSISTINTKYSIAGSYDGKTLKVYMNGNLASSLSLTGSIGTTSSSTVMAIGANPAGSSANGNYYNGRVYSVRIYNRALTDAEIRENYKVDNSNYKIN